jgi:hypothetical protein
MRTILIDGHDVRALTGVSVVGYINGWFAPGTRRGSSDVVADADGELGAALPLAAYLLRIPIQVQGATEDAMVTNLLALGALIGGTTTGGLVSLTRRHVPASGPTVDHTAPGRFVTGLADAILNPQTGRSELQYYQLKGYWLDPATSNRLVP